MKTTILKISKTFFLLLSLVIFQTVNAQAPQKMSFQAVVRNGSNALITTAPVGMKISILQGSSSGTPVYVETQTPTTNSNGLVSLEIGTGTIVSGSFSSINWANGPYFIKTETDPSGGNSYTISGTSQLMSVPYALFAANSTPGPQGIQGLTGVTGAQGPAGMVNYNFLNKTANYTITSTDVTNNLILVNTSSGVITLTLPSASVAGAGKSVFLSGSSLAVYQSLNVICPAGNTFIGVYFNGTNTNMFTTLNSNITWVQLISDGLNKWYVTGLYF